MKTYEYIMSDIQLKIESGYYRPNDQLPSLRDIAKQYHATPVTAKKSLSILEEKGYVFVIDRKGFFVNAPNRKKYLMIFHELKSINECTSTTIDAIEEINVDLLKDFFALNLQPDIKCAKITRTFYNKLLPVGLDYKYLFYKGKIKVSDENADHLQKSIELVLDNYDIHKQLSISVLDDNSAVREKFYLDETDGVFEFKQKYETVGGQLVGVSVTYIPCEEIVLKMSY